MWPFADRPSASDGVPGDGLPALGTEGDLGVPRKWQEICYEEQQLPSMLYKSSHMIPLVETKTMFRLSRLNKGTGDELSTWIANYECI